MDDSRYVYKNDNLINEKGESVMMGWERPIIGQHHNTNN